jgi:hypoxanthine phosphoribosyltransferase
MAAEDGRRTAGPELDRGAGETGDEFGSSLVQAALPVLGGPARAVGGAEWSGFAHPFERDFARILSYYRVRWSYEPTAFALSWDAEGQPAEFFTPDFYLPDLRLYVELTAMRQRLVTRKHRKLRRLRELYPDVRVKLLYRRDYQRLAAAYGEARLRRGRLVGRVLFDEEDIRRRVGELADAIAADMARARESEDPTIEDGPLLLAVGNESAVFLGTLRSALEARGLAVELDRLTLSRYRTGSGRCRVRIRRRPEAALRGRRVLVVEDVVSTGLTLSYLLGWLRRQGAAPSVCALLDRRAARVVDVPIRYAGFEAPNEVLVGFGLSLYRRFRDLPFIAVLEP